VDLGLAARGQLPAQRCRRVYGADELPSRPRTSKGNNRHDVEPRANPPSILPDASFALKFGAMAAIDRICAAWECAECRRYRRLALAFAAAAVCAWALL
jgi:hypothetical protein